MIPVTISPSDCNPGNAFSSTRGCRCCIFSCIYFQEKCWHPSLSFCLHFIPQGHCDPSGAFNSSSLCLSLFCFSFTPIIHIWLSRRHVSFHSIAYSIVYVLECMYVYVCEYILSYTVYIKYFKKYRCDILSYTSASCINDEDIPPNPWLSVWLVVQQANSRLCVMAALGCALQDCGPTFIKILRGSSSLSLKFFLPKSYSLGVNKEYYQSNSE